MFQLDCVRFIYSTDFGKMRLLATLLCIILLALVDLSMQLPQYENCTEEFPRRGLSDCACCKITCFSDGDALGMNMVSCGQSFCPEEKLIKYVGGDNSLVYPECCRFPLCDV